MKLLKSRRSIPIPKVFFITDRSKIKDIPLGVPYFFGDPGIEEAVIQMLEYELLFQRALMTKIPLNFKKIMKKEGFVDAKLSSKERVLARLGNGKVENKMSTFQGERVFKDFMKDAAFYVDIGVIKSLKIMPTWMESLEEAITVNTTDFVKFDHNMYSKKLDGMYGGVDLKSPERNLIIIDISSSIPQNVSQTCLLLAKNLSESFYADIMITGSKTTLYAYEELDTLDVSTIYDENGQDNDQVYFKRLLTGSEKHYNTLIVFGDEDCPGHEWRNVFNNHREVASITEEEGREMNRWTVQKIVSFHTGQGFNYTEDRYYEEGVDVAAYGRWFTCDPKNIKFMKDWVYALSK